MCTNVIVVCTLDRSRLTEYLDFAEAASHKQMYRDATPTAEQIPALFCLYKAAAAEYITRLWKRMCVPYSGHRNLSNALCTFRKIYQ